MSTRAAYGVGSQAATLSITLPVQQLGGLLGPGKEAPPPLQKRKAPPKPEARTEAEQKRDATIAWWKSKEQPRGAGQDYAGTFLPWFHGPIDRRETERLLKPRKVGCFLVRVSENRFGCVMNSSSPSLRSSSPVKFIG